jgi:hypothetical protein
MFKCRTLFRSTRALGWLLLTLHAAACGDETNEKQHDFTGSLLPLVPGNRWTYRVTDDDEVTQKTVRVGASRTVGGDGPNAGATAFEVTSDKDGASAVSLVADLDGKIVRYTEDELSGKGKLERSYVWAPHRLYIDGTAEHVVAGASWLEEPEETSTKADEAAELSTLRERWQVIASQEKVTVPAGTFDALVVQKAGGVKLKTYWYVPGLGKVKETGGQTEELVDYDVKE